MDDDSVDLHFHQHHDDVSVPDGPFTSSAASIVSQTASILGNQSHWNLDEWDDCSTNSLVSQTASVLEGMTRVEVGDDQFESDNIVFRGALDALVIFDFSSCEENVCEGPVPHHHEDEKPCILDCKDAEPATGAEKEHCIIASSTNTVPTDTESDDDSSMEQQSQHHGLTASETESTALPVQYPSAPDFKERLSRDLDFIEKSYPYDVDRSGLSSGSYGDVFRALDLENNAQVVMKRVDHEGSSAELILNEVHALLRFKNVSDGVVQILDSIEAPYAAFIVMETCAGRDLFDEMYEHEDGRSFSHQEIKTIARQLLQTIATVHEAGYVHSDVKPENIMVSFSNDGLIQLKLIDFGFCRPLGRSGTLTLKCGTPGYMAPELLEGNGYDTQADIFSIGRTLSNLLSKVGLDDPSVTFSERMNLSQFVLGLLHQDPSRRLTAAEALQHDFLRDL